MAFLICAIPEAEMTCYLSGIPLGVIGALAWSAGRTLTMVPLDQWRWRGRRPPSIAICLGFALPSSKGQVQAITNDTPSLWR